ncbi:hypothetical protein IWQ57_005322, partial [Coemansia nantahalensis]
MRWAGSQLPNSAVRGNAGPRSQGAGDSDRLASGEERRALPQHGRSVVAHPPSSALAPPAPDFTALPSHTALADRQQQREDAGCLVASDAPGRVAATPPGLYSAGLDPHAQLARNPPTNPLPRLPSAMEHPVPCADAGPPGTAAIAGPPTRTDAVHDAPAAATCGPEFRRQSVPS